MLGWQRVVWVCVCVWVRLHFLSSWTGRLRPCCCCFWWWWCWCWRLLMLMLLLLPCHEPASKARNQQPDIFFERIIWPLLVCHAAAAGGCWGSCSCCCCSCCSCCCIAAASAAASSGGGAGAGVCWCCCCSCRAMNQLPRQETNSQTFFSRPTRNSKTPPNFVPKMTRNHSQEQAPRRPERPFWNPTRKLVWLLLFCYAAAGGCWACCSYCSCC